MSPRSSFDRRASRPQSRLVRARVCREGRDAASDGSRAQTSLSAQCPSDEQTEEVVPRAHAALARLNRPLFASSAHAYLSLLAPGRSFLRGGVVWSLAGQLPEDTCRDALTACLRVGPRSGRVKTAEGGRGSTSQRPQGRSCARAESPPTSARVRRCPLGAHASAVTYVKVALERHPRSPLFPVITLRGRWEQCQKSTSDLMPT